ncbi:MAG: M15 family metallopeptidase [Prevotella sp.]|nr:M15 family metallopeptidase [Prevotella sp.]
MMLFRIHISSTLVRVVYAIALSVTAMIPQAMADSHACPVQLPQPRGVTTQWKAGVVMTEQQVARFGLDSCFTVCHISDGVFARMNGRSFKNNPQIVRADLRYLRVLHYDADGNILAGEMVCNKAIAADLVAIFRKLFDARYPIERMVLIDDYDANDERSMSANNSSCFCFRKVAGARTLSKHAQGMAVDINPLYNPCVKTRNGRRIVQPAVAGKWCDRTRNFKYKISRGDLCYRLFRERGFRWGGDWKNSKDYQHFEK